MYISCHDILHKQMQWTFYKRCWCRPAPSASRRILQTLSHACGEYNHILYHLLSIRWVNLINTYWYISTAGIYSRKTNWHTETSHHNNNNKNKPTFGRRQEPGHRMCHCRGAFVDRTLLKERISFGIRQICQINIRSWWSLKTKRGRGDDGESGGVAGDDDVLVLLLVSQLPHLLDVCLVLQMIRVSEAYFLKPWQMQLHPYKIKGYSERFLQSLAHFQ